MRNTTSGYQEQILAMQMSRMSERNIFKCKFEMNNERKAHLSFSIKLQNGRNKDCHFDHTCQRRENVNYKDHGSFSLVTLLFERKGKEAFLHRSICSISESKCTTMHYFHEFVSEVYHFILSTGHGLRQKWQYLILFR